MGYPQQLGSLVLPILMEMQQQHWEVHFRFVRHEGNTPANMMARLAWQDSSGYRRYMDPPSAIRETVVQDKQILHTVMAL
ncbi:hypothetical protein V6N11_064523 [Hibiscus sabdariffa]|uniref:Uncharacterized protein n=2 Tax=Hibiscus sabdariffa TaxID=183260 RepID=A0ABR2DAW3_9ROSI